jgi:hypothetical protein
MKYWGYLAAKLAAAFGLLYGLRWAIIRVYPSPEPYSFAIPHRDRYYVPNDPFAHDLAYTFAMLAFTLVAVGVLWAVVWDQRYRCRTCLRRLRMPILTGSWTHILMGRPRTEYICPYGHGTLKVEELQITGHQEPDWEPHDEDIWKELYSLEGSKK